MYSSDPHGGARETHLPADFLWPGNKRLGVFFRVAFEWWSDGKWPAIGPMGNPLAGGVVDTNALSFAEYGHRRGIQRVLRAYERHGVRGTFLVSGLVAHQHASIVRDIAQAGHEIVAHSWAMDYVPALMKEEDEIDNIRRTTNAIFEATGERPVGWGSPRGTPSRLTPRLLAMEGYVWHGDTLNDDLPYKVDFGDCSIIAFPSAMEINDLPVYLRHGQSPRQFVELFEDWLDYCRNVEPGAACIYPTIHSHVFCRPLGMSAYEKLLAMAKGADDLWLGTRNEAIAHIRKLGLF
ncbi:MAG: polysaccharide deacetylase family protein [Lautropia sp.]